MPRVRAVPAVPGICWSKPSVQRQQRQQKQHRHRRHCHRQRGRPETAMKLTPKSLTARRTKSSRPCHGIIWWSWWAWPIFSISYASDLQYLVILLCVFSAHRMHNLHDIGQPASDPTLPSSSDGFVKLQSSRCSRCINRFEATLHFAHAFLTENMHNKIEYD